MPETQFMANEKSILIVGAGSIGTALGHNIARKKANPICLLSIEEDVVNAINTKRNNFKYFPNVKLSKMLKATTDVQSLAEADIIFLAIPSNAAVDYVLKNKAYIRDDAILLNMAKGFSKEQKTITETLSAQIPNPICAFKGPTFARDLMSELPTGFTIGTTIEEHKNIFRRIFADTPIYVDFSEDVKGVELLSILKNIYAIATGIVDAHFDSPNLRFLFLTRAFNEMKDILIEYGGKEKTLFNYCGYGDFTLTPLTDLSRNRTLGLLIGKGFFTENISDKVVLEGKIAVNVFCNEISSRNKINGHYPIIGELFKVFNEPYDLSKFVNSVLR